VFNDALIEKINAAYRRLSATTEDLASADREHRRLEADRGRADLDLHYERREVERLHLIVRLLGTQSSEGIPG
jgi:hypothetical protein